MTAKRLALLRVLKRDYVADCECGLRKGIG